MIIKSDNGHHAIFVILQFYIAWLISMLLQIEEATSRIVGFLLLVLFEILDFRIWIAFGRILIMDKEGCTVRFLFFYQKYRWDELQTRHLERYVKTWSFRQPYTAGVVFSKQPNRKPRRMLPADYCWRVHPFHYFFVYFKPDIPEPKLNHSHSKIYEVDESEFLSKLAEWGVTVFSDSRNL